MMKRWLTLFCLTLSASVFLGASAWEGSAMMSAYGEFPDTGYYAACNSFPRNTAVEVVNLENGKTVTVIITKDLDNPGIFLLLSPDAAKSLSMVPGMVSRVRVSAPRNITEALPPSAPSADPDFNPSLLASRTPKQTPAAAPQPAPAAPPAPPPVVAEPLPEAASEKTADIAVEGTAEERPAPDSIPAQTVSETAAPSAKETPIVRPEILARSEAGPKTEPPVTAYLELPESRETEAASEGGVVAYGLEQPDAQNLPIQTELADPSLVPDDLPEAALLRRAYPADPEPSAYLADCEIRMDDTGKPEALSIAEAGPSPEPVPSEAELSEPEPQAGVAASSSGSENGGEAVSESANTMEAAGSRSTAETAAPVPKAALTSQPTEAPRGTTPVFGKAATALEPGKYYIQIGAYKSSIVLEGAAQKLYGSFPVTIDTVQTGAAPLYRLFVGPLGRDETGVMLLKVRSLGFKDAYLKK